MIFLARWEVGSSATPRAAQLGSGVVRIRCVLCHPCHRYRRTMHLCKLYLLLPAWLHYRSHHRTAEHRAKPWYLHKHASQHHLRPSVSLSTIHDQYIQCMLKHWIQKRHHRRLRCMSRTRQASILSHRTSGCIMCSLSSWRARKRHISVSRLGYRTSPLSSRRAARAAANHEPAWTEKGDGVEAVSSRWHQTDTHNDRL